MITQDFYLPKYGWHVRAYYAVTTYWRDRILRDLYRIGCRGERLSRSWRNLTDGALNTGLTYSDLAGGETVLGRTYCRLIFKKVHSICTIVCTYHIFMIFLYKSTFYFTFR